MKKHVELEIELYGDGTVREIQPGQFSGGVPDLVRTGVAFSVYQPGAPDEMPTPFEGALQLSITGTPEGYREAARYLLALAELDTAADPDYHDHQDDFVSDDGLTRLDLVMRRSAPGL